MRKFVGSNRRRRCLGQIAPGLFHPRHIVPHQHKWREARVAARRVRAQELAMVVVASLIMLRP
jgi:hypothetical protein